MIAALYVKTGGPYFNIEGVDPWDATRDARLYAGPFPVVAHPPCSRWCRLAGLVEARWGHKRGEDDGCFKAALEAVRTYGGVLEHPAYSDAWAAFDLPIPSRSGGWQKGFCGGWSCYVEQGRYGHPAKKGTWLYAYGAELSDMRWGYGFKSDVLVSYADMERYPDRPRISKDKASATPIEFREALISLAQSVDLRR
jgi:hypothetical protein